MDKHEFDSSWVDRYVRNELSAEEETAFEEALMDSAELQQELETVLGLREALAQSDSVDEGLPAANSGQHSQDLDARNNWQPLAMAAAVVLAVFSTTMYWQVSTEVSGLRSEIENLQLPRDGVLRVPVDIMRSGGNQTPDVIIQKPVGNSMVLLDIELQSSFAALERVQMTLRDSEETALVSWVATPTDEGRISAAIDVSRLPDGRAWLEMSDTDGTSSDRRLLEFR